ncbi:MAG TPA: hypothetical protein VMU12_02860 [Candidatus Paceibacterota bacterium]|nr:hypothetical protein [Candidatus Paceibacterota bacterium]
MGFFSSVKRTVIILVVLAISLMLAVIIGLFSAIRVFGPVVVGVFAIALCPVIGLFGLWVKERVSPAIGKVFIVAALIILVATIFQFKFPGVFRLGGAGIDTVNRASETQALLMETPREVPCASPWFIGDAEHSRPRYWWSSRDDPIVCYDRPGKHPKLGVELVAVTAPIVELIETQHARPTPAPVIIAVQATPTPVTEVAWSEPVTPPRQ